MSSKFSSVLFFAAIVAAIPMCACSKSHASAAQISRGKEIFDTNCAPCHEASGVQLPTQPPKLEGLFAKPTLPSGAPATDAQVRSTIVQGRGIMPPFGPVLQPDDLDALIAYLHTR